MYSPVPPTIIGNFPLIAISFIKLAASLKLDQIFFKRLVSDFVKTDDAFEFYNENVNDIVEFARQNQIVTNAEKLISKEFSEYKTRAKNEPCEILRLNLIGLINASGDYFPCLYQYVNAGLKYGNIKEESLNSILERRADVIKEIECNSCEFCRHWSLRTELAKYRNSSEILKCNDPHYNFV